MVIPTFIADRFQRSDSDLFSARIKVMTPARLADLNAAMAAEWRLAIRRWERKKRVVLLDEVREILTRAACAWAGVPLMDQDARKRARDFGRMVDGVGGIGPRLWKGKLARLRVERWIARFVENIRGGTLYTKLQSPLSVMAAHYENGKLLPPKTAAVEVINLIRPTVAISRLIVSAAQTLHDHPAARARIGTQRDDAYLDFFVQEVRRFYPAFEFIPGEHIAMHAVTLAVHFLTRGATYEVPSHDRATRFVLRNVRAKSALDEPLPWVQTKPQRSDRSPLREPAAPLDHGHCTASA